ncbi:MAG: PilW family protein [Noviherbaspirillum sp.]
MKSHGSLAHACAFATRTARYESGLTLVELMISITLGLLIVMAATALLLSSKSGYVIQDEDAHIQDTGRYALENISRAVRQAAYENWDTNEAPIVLAANLSANIAGLDARSLKSTTPGIESPVTKTVQGSDVLALRFFGVGNGENGDGSMVNCAGFGVGAPGSKEEAEERRGWSIFYVAEDASGEPELYCKYLGKSSWASQAIARGVESFQVLYGLDLDGDGMPNRFLNATAITALDDTLVLEGATAEERDQDKNKKTHWKKIVVVKVALLVRGTQNARADSLTIQHDLFGKEYADANAATDPGVRIKEETLRSTVRNRLRRTFLSTIQLRN